jgi:hypothetical protein
MAPSRICYIPGSPVHGVHQNIYPSHGDSIPNFKNFLIKYVFLSLYINIEKNIRINNIKSPKMLTLRFFFPSVRIGGVYHVFELHYLLLHY